ncbi:MAG: FecCD family ABC transporter permease [Spirochaetia bacterium]
MIRSSRLGVIILLIIIACLCFIASLVFGAVSIPLVSSLLTGSLSDTHRFILLFIRLPRSIIALLTGTALAVSGCAVQGLFRNPLASPEVLGVSAGGSLAALIAIISGISAFSLFTIPLFAITGCLGAAFFVYSFSLSGEGSVNLLYIVLAGLALSSLLNGIISAVLLFSHEYDVTRYIHWTMGSLENRRWEHVLISVPVIVPAVILLSVLGKQINILSFGEEAAWSIGLSVTNFKRITLVLVSVLTGVAVSVSGTISFIGILIPHLLRIVIGPDNRYLLPASAAAGGAFLLLCDTVGRSVFAPFEIKAGIITALTGGPYFLYLLYRFRKRGAYGS